jgi:16S rRNA C967 or C1407 C5-methylase (RsmB/RsmF family)/NOL1/NOP2/fmu family ribosome biogenesis protein
MFPRPFEQQMQALLGEEFLAFRAALEAELPVSIRTNRRFGESHAPPGAQRVPWHPQGYYLTERPVFTLDPCFHGGGYYVQEASSMLLYQAVAQLMPAEAPLNVLDLCASPGGKATLLADMLPNGSLLVANEIIRSRVGILRENLERWGVFDLAVTSVDAADFKTALPDFFDVVVVDAPCSGEGMFRKDPDSIREWSPARVAFCESRQKHILAAAVATLAPGGLLVYSTCTYNTMENSGNARWLEEVLGLSRETLHLKPDWGIVDTGFGYQCFPHRVRGEGFFISVFRKPDGKRRKRNTPPAFQHLRPVTRETREILRPWLTPPSGQVGYQLSGGEILALSEAMVPVYLALDQGLKARWFGTLMGAVKGKDLVPSHAFSQSRLLQPPKKIALDRNAALLYLKREAFDLPPATPPGWVLTCYQDCPLGWIKVLPGRCNNYLPPERRIRMDIV